MVTGSEEQSEQIGQLHAEDADRYSAQRWRPNGAGQDGVNDINSSLNLLLRLRLCVHVGPFEKLTLSSDVFLMGIVELNEDVLVYSGLL